MVATPTAQNREKTAAQDAERQQRVLAQREAIAALTHPVITWEALPEGFQLEEKPVENTGQPLIAGALRESLELAQWIQPGMLLASNFGLCATLNDELTLKAPDWLYIPRVNDPDIAERKAYTPRLEGDIPAVVIEFLSDNEGGEYSVKRTFPPGKWFFYEQILQIPTYIVFDPDGGLLETYRLTEGRYVLENPDENGHNWLPSMNLFIGTWRGVKEGRDGYWLRWWTAERELLPWAVEKLEAAQQQAEAAQQQAEAAQQQAEAAQQQAEAERQRAERLAELLRQQGIDPEQI